MKDFDYTRLFKAIVYVFLGLTIVFLALICMTALVILAFESPVNLIFMVTVVGLIALAYKHMDKIEKL